MENKTAQVSHLQSDQQKKIYSSTMQYPDNSQ